MVLTFRCPSKNLIATKETGVLGRYQAQFFILRDEVGSYHFSSECFTREDVIGCHSERERERCVCPSPMILYGEISLGRDSERVEINTREKSSPKRFSLLKIEPR